jgi:hypothetical protein
MSATKVSFSRSVVFAENLEQNGAQKSSDGDHFC